MKMPKLSLDPKSIVFSLIAAAVSGMVETGVEKGLHAWDNHRNKVTLKDLEAITDPNVTVTLEELDK